MLTYSEMLAVVDRHTSFNPVGRAIVNIVEVRNELFWNWGFTELQVQRIIMDMRDRGLI